MVLLVIIIILAFIFDYINGFHDAANSIATIVSTKVLTPFQAVLWAAVFNFAAFFIAKYIIGEFKVANSVASSVFEQFITLKVILCGLIAAITWNLFTWWLGIPSSSSHTLIGGFIGAAVTASGSMEVINYHKVLPTVYFIVLAPLIGMFVSFVLTLIIVNVCRKANPYRAESWFKRLQLASSAALSLGHGSNDAQKVMGIIAAAMVSAGQIDNIKAIPDWVPLACFTCIALGTMSGGWKIVKTMGTRITKVTPLEGVAAESAGAVTLFMTEHIGIPASTTHVITGAIMGVGATKRLSAVRWGVTVSLLWAWVLTIPISGLLAAFTYFIINLFI
jgi:PiT family inorganic phosphate transporter